MKIKTYSFKDWFKCAGIRAIKTMAQTAISLIGTSLVITDVDWQVVLSASILACVLSLLTSIAGIPELDNATTTTTTVTDTETVNDTVNDGE